MVSRQLVPAVFITKFARKILPNERNSSIFGFLESPLKQVFNFVSGAQIELLVKRRVTLPCEKRL